MATGSAGIDRIAPTRRPVGQRVVMRQRWRDLLFLHWPVDPAAIQKLLPSRLTADTFEGQAYIGLVPFAMQGVRPVWSPSVPGLSSFLEVNVRTYVHCEGADPGVWFFSLDAANPVAVEIARRLWGLPYHFARMSLSRRDDGVVAYRSARLEKGGDAGCSVVYRPDGTAAFSEPGTLPFFLAERYLLYSQQGSRQGSQHGRLQKGQVWHTPYPIQPATLLSLDDSLVAAAGVSLLAGEKISDPPLIHFAFGVDVQVFPLRNV